MKNGTEYVERGCENKDTAKQAENWNKFGLLGLDREPYTPVGNLAKCDKSLCNLRTGSAPQQHGFKTGLVVTVTISIIHFL